MVFALKIWESFPCNGNCHGCSAKCNYHQLLQLAGKFVTSQNFVTLMKQFKCLQKIVNHLFVISLFPTYLKWKSILYNGVIGRQVYSQTICLQFFCLLLFRTYPVVKNLNFWPRLAIEYIGSYMQRFACKRRVITTLAI